MSTETDATTETNRIEDIDPDEAVEHYRRHERTENDRSDNTLRRKKSNLRAFRQFCENEGIDVLSDLTRTDVLNGYPMWLDENRDLNTDLSRSQHYSDIRIFLRHAERSGWVYDGLSESVPDPDVDKKDKVREDALEPEFVERILDRLSRLHYASNRHVALLLMYEVPCRAQSIEALDVSDYTRPSQSDHDHGYVEFEHRPETGTTLKNKSKSERVVALADDVCRVLNDYIDNKRNEHTEDNGRKPLVTSRMGRATADGALQTWARWATRPCFVGDECTCDGSRKKNLKRCTECDNTGTHPIRKAGVIRWRREGVPPEDLSERCDNGVKQLREHYYQDSEDEKMNRRSGLFTDD